MSVVRIYRSNLTMLKNAIWHKAAQYVVNGNTKSALDINKIYTYLSDALSDIITFHDDASEAVKLYESAFSIAAYKLNLLGYSYVEGVIYGSNGHTTDPLYVETRLDNFSSDNKPKTIDEALELKWERQGHIRDYVPMSRGQARDILGGLFIGSSIRVNDYTKLTRIA